jgi:hypothetical protein
VCLTSSEICVCVCINICDVCVWDHTNCEYSHSTACTWFKTSLKSHAAQRHTTQSTHTVCESRGVDKLNEREVLFCRCGELCDEEVHHTFFLTQFLEVRERIQCLCALPCNSALASSDNLCVCVCVCVWRKHAYMCVWVFACATRRQNQYAYQDVHSIVTCSWASMIHVLPKVFHVIFMCADDVQARCIYLLGSTNSTTPKKNFRQRFCAPLTHSAHAQTWNELTVMPAVSIATLSFWILSPTYLDQQKASGEGACRRYALLFQQRMARSWDTSRTWDHFYASRAHAMHSCVKYITDMDSKRLSRAEKNEGKRVFFIAKAWHGDVYRSFSSFMEYLRVSNSVYGEEFWHCIGQQARHGHSPVDEWRLARGVVADQQARDPAKWHEKLCKWSNISWYCVGSNTASTSHVHVRCTCVGLFHGKSVIYLDAWKLQHMYMHVREFSGMTAHLSRGGRMFLALSMSSLGMCCAWENNRGEGWSLNSWFTMHTAGEIMHHKSTCELHVAAECLHGFSGESAQFSSCEIALKPFARQLWSYKPLWRHPPWTRNRHKFSDPCSQPPRLLSHHRCVRPPTKSAHTKGFAYISPSLAPSSKWHANNVWIIPALLSDGSFRRAATSWASWESLIAFLVGCGLMESSGHIIQNWVK